MVVGGYSGGLSEDRVVNEKVHNGESSITSSDYGTGAGYFGGGRGSINHPGIAHIGGQGGNSAGSSTIHFRDSGGDGGIAGNGGTVKTSQNAKIYAFNGNMITNGNETGAYDKEYFEYKSDGTKTNNKLSVITRVDGKRMIPLKIFAQDGILRAIYKINAHWDEKENYNYTFLKKLFADTLDSNVVNIKPPVTDYTEVKNYLIRGETTCTKFYGNSDEKNNYVNTITGDSQGIGSGAGYIELSNGTFEILSELN